MLKVALAPSSCFGFNKNWMKLILEFDNIKYICEDTKQDLMIKFTPHIKPVFCSQNSVTL